MNIIVLLQQTLSQPNVFWSAISAIASIFALSIVVIEIPKLRNEIAKQKVQGLEYIQKLLTDDEFIQSKNKIVAELHNHSKVYPTGLEYDLIFVLGRLDYVAKLIKIGYLDENFFSYIFSNEISIVNVAFRHFEHLQGSDIIRIEENFPDGDKLLYKMAIKSSSMAMNVANRVFKRRSKTK